MAFAGEFTDQIPFWKNQIVLKTEPKERVVYYEKNAEHHDFSIEVTEETLDRLSELKISLQEYLLCCLGNALSRWRAKNGVKKSLTIDLEGHGRPIEAGLENVVGWLTSLFPFKVSTRQSILEQLYAVMDYLRRLPSAGIGYRALVSYCGEEDIKSYQEIFIFIRVTIY